MPKSTENLALLGTLPVEAQVILETCYDVMMGSPKHPSADQGFCTHLEIEGDKVRYVGMPGVLGDGVFVSKFISELIRRDLMDCDDQGRLKPTHLGFAIGKLASETGGRNPEES